MADGHRVLVAADEDVSDEELQDSRLLAGVHVVQAVGEAAREALDGVGEFDDQGGRHVHFAPSATPATLDALKKRLELAGIPHRGPVTHDGGDHSLYVDDPEGNVVEVWDFFSPGFQ